MPSSGIHVPTWLCDEIIFIQIGDFLSLGSFWISYFLRFASWVAKINATGEDSSGPHNDTSTEVWTESNEVEIDERVEWDAKDPYLICKDAGVVIWKRVPDYWTFVMGTPRNWWIHVTKGQ